MYTVVVADDEFELRQALIHRIKWEQIGFQVVGEAENGIEALQLVEELEPDLLLTDIKMPFISGLELARAVREIQPAMQIAFLSGYDEFAYAQEAIQYNIIKYLLKPISSVELTEHLVSIKAIMDQNKSFFNTNNVEDSITQLKQERFLMSLLLDNEVDFEKSNDQLIKQAINCHLIETKENNNHAIFVLSLLNKDNTNITKATHGVAITNIVKKYFSIGYFYSNGKIVAVLSGQQWSFDKYLEIVINEIVQSIKKALQVNCFIGISSIINNLLQGNLAYHQAMSALQYAIGANKNSMFIEDIEHQTKITYEYARKVVRELENLIKTSNQEKIENYLNTVFIEVINNNISCSDIDMLMMQLFSSITAIIYSVCDNDSITTYFKQISEYSKVLKVSSFNEKRTAMLDFCLKSQAILNNQKKHNCEIICDELQDIIENEYSNDKLSLVSVSEKLHVSSNYLSSLVKKTMGSSFITLLTKKRMNVAKELVMYSSLKMLEIANMCGYSDQHYFSYCFKKYYGLSPNKMREGKNENKV